MRDWRNWIAPAAILGTLIVSSFVAALVAVSLSSMRDKANEIDDSRSVAAARAALITARKRLSGTVEDNAIWREAYEAMTGDNRAAWISDNWGMTSADYKLYDGVIVATSDGTPVASYLKGKPFDATQLLGAGLKEQIGLSSKPDRPVATEFYRIGDDLALVATHAVQNAKGMRPDGRGFVLTMLKTVTPPLVAAVGEDYLLPGLHLSADPPGHGELGIPLTERNGKPVAYLAWPSRNLGTELYESSNLLLEVAFALTGLLFVTGIAAGYFEVQALRRFAAVADCDARRDPLSGLLNRNGMIRALEAEIATSSMGQGVSLLLVDLDGFKAVNDTWGHLVGDQLIRDVGNRLSGCHERLSFVARFGGDEFALAVAPGGDPAAVAAAVLQALAEPFNSGGRVIGVSASIGFATHHPGMDGLELVRRADIALYQVKNMGRAGSCAYSEKLDRDREGVAELEEKLRQALNDDSLSVAFQPVVAAKTGLPSGVEVLARWRTPQGPVSPEVFIPVAEKSGLVFQLGAVVLKKAIEFASQRPGIEISVNVSPMQVCAANFAETVASTLAEASFEPSRLILEVTEGVLFDSPLQAQRAIEALRAIGVRFALDDFGAGYASIGTLRSFTFDRLKLDRSLLKDLNSKSGRSVLGATVSLADALRIPVVVEGVETAEQAKHVRSLGCRYMQGYYFGRPMSAEDFDRAFSAAATVG